MMAPTDAAIGVDGVVTRFGALTLHDGVSFTVRRGVVAALIGASGSGKSVLLREIIGLDRPRAGVIALLGERIDPSGPAMSSLRRRFGVMFQDGALFSSLTVAQNVAVPLEEHARLPKRLQEAVVKLRIALAGLPPDAAFKFPATLSGGMRKRAAIARALALEPEILFLDEPTAGLDAIAARDLERLLRSLVDNLGITVFLVTHDITTLYAIVDQLIILHDGKVIADGPVAAASGVEHPWIQAYFAPRGAPGEV